MGLDMYLEKCNRKAWGFKDLDIDEVKVNNPTLYEELKPLIVMRGKYHPWETFFAEVGYWRKANAIHRWFVENVQNDEDDCGRYEVSKEQLEVLLEVCNEVLENCELIEGQIGNGYTFDANGKKIKQYIEGKYVEDTSVAEELLPTTDGFFFGSTDYDEYYIEDIKHTVDIVKEVLASTDFDKEMIVYTSSW